MSASRGASKAASKALKKKQAEANTFKWMDDEAKLLLKFTFDCKVSKEAVGTDWQSVQNKYSDILEWMLEDYPETSEVASESNKDYPHDRSEITKQVLTTKLKAIRIKFRQAVDSGRKSGVPVLRSLRKHLGRLPCYGATTIRAGEHRNRAESFNQYRNSN